MSTTNRPSPEYALHLTHIARCLIRLILRKAASHGPWALADILVIVGCVGWKCLLMLQ